MTKCKEVERNIILTIVATSAAVVLFTGCMGQVQPQQVTQISPEAITVAKVTDSKISSLPIALRSLVFSLLADNRLIVVDPNGVVVVERSLAPAPSVATTRFTGHYIAIGKDRKVVFVLVPGESGSPDRVAVIEVATAQVLTTYQLAESDGFFRSLAVGHFTGRLYLFGNRADGVIVMVLDPNTGAVLTRWKVREPDGHDWLVYQGAISDDEKQLFISYHGSDTTGIDSFDISGDGLHRCQMPVRSDRGCLPGHGGFTFYGDGLLVATGGSVILNIDKAGNIRGGLDTHLPGHLMEFLMDASASRLYAVGSCGYVPGFSALDVKTGNVPAVITTNGIRLQATPEPPEVLVTPSPFVSAIPCGERLAIGSESFLVVGQTTKPVPESRTSGALLFVDVGTGQIFHTIKVPSEPVDVLAAGIPE